MEFKLFGHIVSVLPEKDVHQEKMKYAHKVYILQDGKLYETKDSDTNELASIWTEASNKIKEELYQQHEESGSTWINQIDINEQYKLAKDGEGTKKKVISSLQLELPLEFK